MHNVCELTNNTVHQWLRICNRVPVGELGVTHLNLHKLSSALVTDLEEGLASHVLDARVSLMHELKQLVHNSLQELPVVAQKPGILPHHIPAISMVL